MVLAGWLPEAVGMLPGLVPATVEVRGSMSIGLVAEIGSSTSSTSSRRYRVTAGVLAGPDATHFGQRRGGF